MLSAPAIGLQCLKVNSFKKGAVIRIMGRKERRRHDGIKEDNVGPGVVKVQSASVSNYKGYDVFAQFDCYGATTEEKVFLGKDSNYDNHGNYDNTDNSLIFISNNRKMFHFLCGQGWCENQQAMLDKGCFSEEDYAEFAKLKETVLQQFVEIREVKFAIDIDVEESGVPFSFPCGTEEVRVESAGIKPGDSLGYADALRIVFGNRCIEEYLENDRHLNYTFEEVMQLAVKNGWKEGCILLIAESPRCGTIYHYDESIDMWSEYGTTRGYA